MEHSPPVFGARPSSAARITHRLQSLLGRWKCLEPTQASSETCSSRELRPTNNCGDPMNALFRWLTRAAPLREQSRVYSGGMYVEDIEPRVLHSADLTPFAVPPSLPVHAEIRVVDNSGFGETAANIQQLTRHEVVFLDESVPDYQQILDDIA